MIIKPVTAGGGGFWKNGNIPGFCGVLTMTVTEACRILRAHRFVRKAWQGRFLRRAPTREAVLRSHRVEQTLRQMRPENRRILEKLFMEGVGQLRLCNKMAVRRSGCYRMRLTALQEFMRLYEQT